MELKYLSVICVLMISTVTSNSLERLMEVYKTISDDELIGQQWNSFKSKFNKQYETGLEERLRKNVFVYNLHKINKHNDLFEKGVVTYAMGMNKFGDMLPDEFASVMLMNNVTRDDSAREEGLTFIPPVDSVSIPPYIDWEKLGAVTPVKNQGYHCGSCWSFSATGALEAQHFRKTGRLVSLSEQQLLDCSSSYGNFGCKGGYAHTSFKYIHDNKGIDTENSYPYQEVQDKCRYNPNYSAATCNTFKFIEKSEDALKQAVATYGPVSVDVYSKSFQFYQHGVFYDPNCYSSINKINHMVLAIGYGKSRKYGAYWRVKNSWGANWGEKGYIRIARNRGNQCGIATYACVPVV